MQPNPHAEPEASTQAKISLNQDLAMLTSGYKLCLQFRVVVYTWVYGEWKTRWKLLYCLGFRAY